MSAFEVFAPPPPLQLKRESAEGNTTASFSSVSTLSSMPLSSQSSSKRTIKHGLQAVTNSDSGSADSDSSDELADVTSFVSRKKRKLTPPGQDLDHAIPIPSTVKPERRSGRLSDDGRQKSAPSRMPSPPRMVYKHSLANMIKQKEKSEKTEAKIQEAEAAFEEARRKRAEELEQRGGLSGGLEAAVEDDSDQGERMKLAIARTEALQDEQQFYYFREVKALTSDNSFPAEPGTVWEKYRNNDKVRTQAFLSGFIAQLASSGVIPNAVCGWISDQLLHEKREDLCEAYIEVLRVRSKLTVSTPHASEMLNHFYELSKREAPIPGAVIPGFTATIHLEADGAVPGLQYVLYALQHAHTSHPDQPIYSRVLLTELLPALVDARVAKDSALCEKLADTIQYIIDGVADSQYANFCDNLPGDFQNMIELSKLFRCRATVAMPARSQRSHHVRRMLATHMITGKYTHRDYDAKLALPKSAQIILQRLKTAPEFAISESSDYLILTSLISVLDIAIDSGFSDSLSRGHAAEPSKPSNGFANPNPALRAETDFNAQIDAFTTQLRQMSSRIRDAGTAHLRRTEAKSAIDRLVLRLEHCVRTKPKPKKNVFGGGTGQQRDFLSGFLKHSSLKTDDATCNGEGGSAIALLDKVLNETNVDAEDSKDVSSGESAATGGAESGVVT